MKILIQIFIASMLTGCNSLKISSKKSYVFTSTNNVSVLHKLKLYENKMFDYRITGSLVEVVSSGNWRVEKNKLYLKSFDQYKSGHCKISTVESSNKIEGKFSAYIFNDTGDPLGSALIFYGNNSYVLKQDGIISLNRGLDTTLRIIFLGIEYRASLSDLGSGQDVKIEIVPLSLSKLYLNDEIWMIRKNRVITPLNKTLVRSDK